MHGLLWKTFVMDLWLEVQLCGDIERLLTDTLSTACAFHTLHLCDVEQRLNAAAQIHDGVHTNADLTLKRHSRVVWRKGHERHGWQVVDHDDGQVNQHHLEGPLLHRVHHLFSRHRVAKGPDDGDVTKDHQCKRKKDDATEDAIDRHASQDALHQGVSQYEAPHHHRNPDSDFVVTDASEEHGLDHSHVAVQTNTHLGC